MINRMGMDTRSGRMALSTKAITSTEQSMDRDN